MELKQKHYIQIAICTLLTIICIVLYAWYYKEYIKPQSYSIGNPDILAYEKLAIKDYISSDTVLFSQNINDTSFKVENGVATYDYIFDSKDYNGLINNYALFVNEKLLNDTQNAGTITGVYTIKYIDVNNINFNTTNINISLTFQSKSSMLRVSFAEQNDNLGLLMNYFKHNDFIITVCANPFTMDAVQTDDEFGRIACNVNVNNDGKVYVEYNKNLHNLSNGKIMVARSGELDIFTVLNTNINTITIETDGTYTLNYNEESNEYNLAWQDANYLTINIDYNNAENALVA